MNNTVIEKYINGIPKVELHLHIEGAFEPELMFEIAKRNKFKRVFEKAWEHGFLVVAHAGEEGPARLYE